jgi:hypothetical protein
MSFAVSGSLDTSHLLVVDLVMVSNHFNGFHSPNARDYRPGANPELVERTV